MARRSSATEFTCKRMMKSRTTSNSLIAMDLKPVSFPLRLVQFQASSYTIAITISSGAQAFGLKLLPITSSATLRPPSLVMEVSL